VESHEQDLREEVMDEDTVRMLQEDYTKAELDGPTRALLDFARKLTLLPRDMERADVAALREHGFADADILDAVQLIGYFNFTNRVMDALGIQPDPHMRHRARP
jgi:uncharacterized peroxidase-related enzyme